MALELRRWMTLVEERQIEAGRPSDPPLRKVAAIAVVANPFAGRYVEDLGPLIEDSEAIGAMLAQRALEAMGGLPVESYGKGGVVGLGGEQEHANALLTTAFAAPLRDAVGGALAWIPSFTKLAAPGASIDVPLAHKDALYVRSHYDGVTVTLPPDAPAAAEVALIIVLANRGRLNARVGGMTPGEISARDGLR
ncbi:amino acid synthesis family protein [Roseomonas sp. F4]